MVIKRFGFETLSLDYLPLLHQWLQEPHVMEFWDDGDRSVDDVKRRYFFRSVVKSWIGHINSHPFAYLQMCLLSNDDEMAQWKDPSKNTLGIDIFIGDPNLIGQNLGAPLLKAFIKTSLKSYFPCRLLIDPIETNIRAIKVYEKIGFKCIGSMKSKNQMHSILMLDVE